MDMFTVGRKDGYIYGYLFKSRGIIVLDEGKREYYVKAAEILINGNFVKVNDLETHESYGHTIAGTKARILDNSFINSII
ncbi:hypothetical protein [Terribacillus saccharophilus]|uniref:hypothetical protein n=1 Tax=Terribacillus saccharophilus TaxID=361277 RepID=UPI003D280DF0